MTDTRVRLHHDGTTWLLYAQYSIFGYFLYAFTPSVTLLRDDEHVSDAVAGLHGTCYAVGVVVLGLLAARILPGSAVPLRPGSFCSPSAPASRSTPPPR